MAKREPALSASRAKEYLQCPLKFRYSVVDRLPQPPSEAAVKGTVVHHVLESLFDIPNEDRSVEAAIALLPKAWEKTLAQQPDAQSLFTNPSVEEGAKADTAALVEKYFEMERPTFLSPHSREKFVDARIESGVLLRGIIDRIDEAPDGALRVVDYKTGKAPSQRYIDDALFQMRFYALLLRTIWKQPKRLQLLYLRSAKVLTLDPLPRDIDAFEEEITSLWQRIKADALAGQFHPKKTPLCGWCPFQSACPQFGGTVLPIPEPGLRRLLEIEDSQSVIELPDPTGQ